MGKFSLKGLKGGLKGVGGKVKILGGKAKVKGKDWLKEKWTGKLQSSSQPPKKDLLADMPVTAGTFLAAGGREPEKKEEKPSILGGIKEGLGKGVSKYKCRHCGTETWARKGSGPDKEQLCVKCYQQYMAQLPASMGGKWTEPETAKKPGSGPTVEQKEEAMERIREEHTGAKRIGFNTSNIGKKIGGIIASGIMMAAAYGEAFLYFPEFAQLVLIVGGIALAFIIISMFVKNAGGYLFLGFIAVSGFALWQLGILTPFIDQYLPPVADAFQNMWSLGSDVWFNTQCILSNPANAQTCMEARQRNATESVNKLGPYETVELKWGRRLDGSYDTDPVESGQDYTLDVSFFNKNNAVYEINFTEINIR